MTTPVPANDLVIRLRRMTAEPITSDTYTQADMVEVLERYPLPDTNGTEPDDYGWLGAWDINQAAADVWEEKASLLATDFDFSADGGDYKRSQAHAQMLAMASRYRSMRKTGALELKAYPKPLGAMRLNSWIGNLSELDSGVEDDYIE
jgi:hypothetical protein